jgi:prepilin-type N-terminal cleavage/methylation domain-containing protein
MTRGFSVPELMVAVSLILLLSAVAVPLVQATVVEARTWAGARHVAARLRLARMEALKRSAAVGLRFEPAGPDYRYSFYVDGNGNGIRSADIARGIDRRLLFSERLADLFPGVAFGITAGVAPIEADPPLVAGSDPIRIGSNDILTFTPRGTATAGTLYLRGPANQQYAIRVLGSTARTRVLRFDRRLRQWIGW